MRILCFVDYYLPGFKAGGPIKTITGMVERMGEEYEFYIVTRDRDFKDDQPYSNIQINSWNTVGKAKVYYISPDKFTFRNLYRLMAGISYDVLYLNSFFSFRATILPILVRLLSHTKKTVILAPRGEFSPGALKIKFLKKIIYIKIFVLSMIGREFTFQVSSLNEAENISTTLGNNYQLFNKIVITGNIIIAPDIISNAYFVSRNFELHHEEPLRIVFLSRISRKKNLDYLLNFLRSVSCELIVNIYGTQEDREYWRDCEKLITMLPSNILAFYGGGVAPENVPAIFAANDLFVFPTRGENFGHVVLESLSVGTPVILSDQTPWQSDPDGAVEIIPLSRPKDYVVAIERWASFDRDQLQQRRQAALRYADHYITSNSDLALEANRNMFQYAIGQVPGKTYT
jgi:glycosyltransferase involved in cell wall biosynthesis